MDIETIRKGIDKKIAFITKAARKAVRTANKSGRTVSKVAKGVLKTQKFGKDMKYLVNDIKPTKRKQTPKSVREAVFKQDNYRCVKCGSTKNLEVDHKVSLANGGTNKMANLQTLCQDCNRRKGAS
jgi:5-methylcytosine-specific restriction protein A